MKNKESEGNFMKKNEKKDRLRNGLLVETIVFGYRLFLRFLIELFC